MTKNQLQQLIELAKSTVVGQKEIAALTQRLDKAEQEFKRKYNIL